MLRKIKKNLSQIFVTLQASTQLPKQCNRVKEQYHPFVPWTRDNRLDERDRRQQRWFWARQFSPFDRLALQMAVDASKEVTQFYQRSLATSFEKHTFGTGLVNECSVEALYWSPFWWWSKACILHFWRQLPTILGRNIWIRIPCPLNVTLQDHWPKHLGTFAASASYLLRRGCWRDFLQSWKGSKCSVETEKRRDFRWRRAGLFHTVSSCLYVVLTRSHTH